MKYNIKDLFDKCKNNNLSLSVTYQSVTCFSIEIYRNKDLFFYTDGHVKLKKAIKKGFKFLEKWKHQNSQK